MTFTPTHRVSKPPFYRHTRDGEKFPRESLAVGDLVALASDARPDGVGDVWPRKADGAETCVSLECLEPLAVVQVPAATIKRDVLVNALVEGGARRSQAELLADAVEHRSK